MQGNEPALSIRQLDSLDLALPKRVCVNTFDRCPIGPHGVFLQTTPQIDIPVNQLGDCDLTACIIDPIQQVTLYRFFFLAEFFQCRGVHIVPLFITISAIAIKIGFVGTLALSGTEDASLIILALFGQFFAPFRRKALNIVWS